MSRFEIGDTVPVTLKRPEYEVPFRRCFQAAMVALYFAGLVALYVMAFIK